jgi:hypothetical protein
MKKSLRASEVEALLREIQRYLAYVDAFRTASPPKRDGEHREGEQKEG